jgi:sugar/nucleoside kinase (ribokinase family)
MNRSALSEDGRLSIEGTMKRSGILAAGNLIVDHVKVIDGWPQQGMLANILEEVKSTGGAPCNVLIDLAKMGTGLSLYVAGVIGADSDGRYVVETLQPYGIDTRFVQIVDEIATSYTDVMTNRETGQRTFFHLRGANRILSDSHLTRVDTNARIFHLGYLLLLDELDKTDPEFGVVAARLLQQMQAKGYKTSVDMVSESSERFQQVVTPCLPYIDYLIVNEIEAGNSTNLVIRRNDDSLDIKSLKSAAQRLLEGGVRRLVAIHFPEGGYALTSSRVEFFEPSYRVHEDEIRGAVGAGDAFCAGLLYGLHEQWDIAEALNLAHASARFNLTSPTCTGGAVSLSELTGFVESESPRFPIEWV